MNMAELGVRRLIYTDIVRDGTLTEPNFTAISELITRTGLPVTAAGGIASVQHLIMLKKLGAEGAIIGKAIYTGDIDLKQALKAVEEA
jgi:phosphoribosylformimino-5-aminoimidazole carboxamide ribotide isomerase